MDQYVGNSNMADTSPVPWVKPSDLDAETLITLSADLAEHSDLFESFTDLGQGGKKAPGFSRGDELPPCNQYVYIR